MSSHKISVLVPCYNVEKFARQCLESIRTQSLSDIEVFLINDGSTDTTLSILQEFAQKDPRFKLIDKSNSGYGDSMNIGLNQAQGEYIGIVEPDDYIEPCMFETLYANAKNHCADVVRAAWYEENVLIGQSTIRRSHYLRMNTKLTSLSEPDLLYISPAVWSSIYRRDFLNQSNIRFLPTPGASYQDVSFNFKTTLLAQSFVILDKPLYHYRLHGNNSITKSSNTLSVLHEWEENLQTVRKFHMQEAIKHNIYGLEYRNFKWNFCRLTEKDTRIFLQHWQSHWKLLAKEFPLKNAKPFKIRLYALLIIYALPVFYLYAKRKNRFGKLNR